MFIIIDVLDIVSDLTLKKNSAFLLINFQISLMRKSPELLGRTITRTITTNYHSQLLTHANQGFLNIMKPTQIQK